MPPFREIKWRAYVRDHSSKYATGHRGCLQARRGLLSDVEWLAKDPSAPITTIYQTDHQVDSIGSKTSHKNLFLVVRDDEVDGLWGGNKRRKLDATLPRLLRDGVTDILTCGGAQSAHLSALSAAVANNYLIEGGFKRPRVHLLVRGERPAILTGHLREAALHATSLTFVTRSEYANRQQMLSSYAEGLRRKAHVDSKVAIIEEGCQGSTAMLGLIRMVEWLASSLPEPEKTLYHLVVDSGTGTTAVGLALGIIGLGLPWQVIGVTVAGTEVYYLSQQTSLAAPFCSCDGQDGEPRPLHCIANVSWGLCSSGSSSHRGPQNLPLTWVPRHRPRRFGKVLAGDAEACRKVVQDHGIVLDPIWTLAAWEVTSSLADSFQMNSSAAGEGLTASEESNLTTSGMDRVREKVAVMIHTGGSVLALQGLAQRYPGRF